VVIRHHGDFHLGKTLWARDWVILDFEARPHAAAGAADRKEARCAEGRGMLRSFAYAEFRIADMQG